MFARGRRKPPRAEKLDDTPEQTTWVVTWPTGKCYRAFVVKAGSTLKLETWVKRQAVAPSTAQKLTPLVLDAIARAEATATTIPKLPKLKQKVPKLSAAQAEVMKWLSQGWSARISNGSAVEINGSRICNVDTMAALVRLGLAERESQAPYWVATAEGKKLSPSYCAPDPVETTNVE